jgi:uncharacterized RDD family membrane protein YckC
MAAPAPGAPPVMQAVGALNYAGFGPRLIAYILDGIFLNLLCLLPAAGIWLAMFLPTSRGEEPGLVAWAITAVCTLLIFIVAFGYYIYFVGAKGATPGKKLMKLKVALVDGRYPIGYGKAFLRMIGYAVSGFICYIGFLMILWDKEKRGLHDKIAGTIVIKES